MGVLEAETAKVRDQLSAKSVELVRLSEEHSQQRLDWESRPWESETQAVRSTGLAESSSFVTFVLFVPFQKLL
jgi:hypothetical protein